MTASSLYLPLSHATVTKYCTTTLLSFISYFTLRVLTVTIILSWCIQISQICSLQAQYF
jgi:hypothetical protein